MTDQEINELVARKLGWIEGPGPMWKQSPIHPESYGPKDYCHSIAAAWEIVNWVTSTGDFHLHGETLGWSCTITKDGQMIQWKASKPEMAICMAFLNLEDK